MPVKQALIRDILIGAELRFPSVPRRGRIVPRQLTNAGPRRNADGLPGERIDKRPGSLAVIFDAQSAPAHMTACRSRDSVHEASIGFGDGKQSFLRLRQWDLQNAPGQQTDPNAKDLTGTDPMVMGRTGPE